MTPAQNINCIDSRLLEPQQLISEIAVQLDSQFGYVVVKGLSLACTLKENMDSFVKLCKQLGTPIPHDDSQIVWHILRKEIQTSSIATYSEHNDEAPFHTDAQYREYPEDYFALLTLKKADCGGGISSIISLDAIMQILEADPLGKETTHLFTHKKLPFAVPTVFSQSNHSEVIFSSVFESNNIRYRFDTLMKGIELFPEVLTAEEKALLIHFDEILNSSELVVNFMLENGDILFVNNKKVLHKRTAFKDTSRHLLRIRFNR